MSWFSKKEEVPKIPLANSVPEIPKNDSKKNDSLPELPSFQNKKAEEKLNQEIVKSAVNDSSDSFEENEIEEIPKKELELPESGSLKIPTKTFNEKEELPKLPSLSTVEPPKEKIKAEFSNNNLHKQAEPVFIRIDKFQSSQKDFDNIKEKLEEIDEVLKKIKSVKEKEENEISKWEKEVSEIKSKLSEIDLNIFNQI